MHFPRELSMNILQSNTNFMRKELYVKGHIDVKYRYKYYGIETRIVIGKSKNLANESGETKPANRTEYESHIHPERLQLSQRFLAAHPESNRWFMRSSDCCKLQSFQGKQHTSIHTYHFGNTKRLECKYEHLKGFP